MRQNPIQRTVRSVHIVCIALCTIVAHNIAQNRPDSFPPYPQDNHHCSDDVYLREGGRTSGVDAYKRDKCPNRNKDSVLYAGRVHDLSQYSLAKAALGNDRVLCRERDVKTCPLAALLTLSACRLSASAAVFITAAQRCPATPNTLRYGPPPTGRIVVKMTGHKVAPFSRGYIPLSHRL